MYVYIYMQACIPKQQHGTMVPAGRGEAAELNRRKHGTEKRDLLDNRFSWISAPDCVVTNTPATAEGETVAVSMRNSLRVLCS